MDEERLAQQTEAYLQAVGTAWRTLEEGVPLEEVHCLLEALPPRERKPLEPRDELAPDADRLPHADIPPDLLLPQTPMPLGEALKHHTHLVFLGEPGAGKTTTLQFLGLAFAQKDWAWAKLGLDERRVPVFLSLKAYAETLSGTGDALMRALSDEVASRLQCPVGEARDLVCAHGHPGKTCSPRSRWVGAGPCACPGLTGPLSLLHLRMEREGTATASSERGVRYHPSIRAIRDVVLG